MIEKLRRERERTILGAGICWHLLICGFEVHG